MHRYVIKRLLLLIPVIIGVSLFIFVSMDLAAGDVTDTLGGEDMTEEQLHALRERLGLNDPLLVRYAKYMWVCSTAIWALPPSPTSPLWRFISRSCRLP